MNLICGVNDLCRNFVFGHTHFLISLGAFTP